MTREYCICTRHDDGTERHYFSCRNALLLCPLRQYYRQHPAALEIHRLRAELLLAKARLAAIGVDDEEADADDEPCQLCEQERDLEPDTFTPHEHARRSAP